jgi:hypothetical protein
MTVKVGSHFPNLHRDVYEQIERDVVVIVNLMMKAFVDSNGLNGIDPNKSYNIRYNKRDGKIWVDFWYGEKVIARALSKVESYDVADLHAGARNLKLKVVRKEVIL